MKTLTTLCGEYRAVAVHHFERLLLSIRYWQQLKRFKYPTLPLDSMNFQKKFVMKLLFLPFIHFPKKPLKSAPCQRSCILISDKAYISVLAIYNEFITCFHQFVSLILPTNFSQLDGRKIKQFFYWSKTVFFLSLPFEREIITIIR